jgi:PAS domain S-box-containing protein
MLRVHPLSVERQGEPGTMADTKDQPPEGQAAAGASESTVRAENAALRGQVAELRALLGELTGGRDADPRSDLWRTQSPAERVAHLGSWVWDLASDRVGWSSELYRILGYRPDRDAATMSAFWAALHPDDVALLKARQALVRESGEPGVTAVRVRHRDDTIRHVLFTGSTIRDESGKAIRLAGTVLDITDRKQLEEQLRQAQKREVIGRLAGGVAHDFNNLLTVIQANAALLSQRGPATELAEIMEAAERAAALTRQLLGLSRGAVFRPSRLDVNEAVGGAIRLTGRLIREDVEVRFQPGADIWPIQADPGQIQQVVMNLLVNARDAMPHGGSITIATSRVSLRRGTPGMLPEPRSGEFVVMSFSDTGSGIDEATLTHIFEPFFTTKEPWRGTGLGLPTVLGIVGDAGGGIEVDSHPGRGTLFRVYWPRSPEGTVDPAPPAPARAVAGSETILVVDDDDAVRRLLQRVLREAGYRVLAAGRPSEALALARAEARPVDLLVADMVMPELSGKELARQLGDEGRTGAALFLSGWTPQTAEAGPERLLQKPFSGPQLLAVVREVLDARPPLAPS